MNSVTTHVTGYPLPVSPAAEEERRALAHANAGALIWYEKNEWTFNKPNDSSTTFPQTCIALSGGGIRSAAFSVGVLKGLQEKGVLASTDVISSVSGGGYALAWYYIKHWEAYKNKRPKPDVFSKESMEDLASRASFITTPDMIGAMLANALSIPVNVVANGLWGTHTNTTPARRFYQDQIVKTFMRGDGDVRLEDFAAESPCGRTGNCSLLTHFALPYPLVNTTARIDEDPNHHGSYLARTVFEFAPLRFGNDGFGYVTIERETLPGKTSPLTFPEAIAVSGAAADSSIVPGSAQQIVASALNQDLGFFIDNYNDPEIRKWRKLLPFPFYLLTDTYRRDQQGTDIYLSDGGHSENFGAFSLVRRLCGQIIIVDAEHDLNYQVKSYYKLKTALRRDMQVDFSVREIDQVNRSLRKRSTWATPVAIGSIGRFPVEGKEQTTDRTIDVRYVKLSVDRSVFQGVSSDDPSASAYRQAVEQYGASVVSFFLRKCPQPTQEDPACPFPQESTFDQSYSAEQFMAYVDLGYKIIMNHYK